ncbi:FtsX-like permease family protein [Spiroplasma eriocheiris]|uniref:ABC transporter permease n=1 Tax=Spiroplasma eriocheiris TaxID=315358 RepID=A0A0H3XIM4_9MOLU|nr:ABC transporter permease [Spiroplasma eriocheiris]AHF57887.1 putative transmembrane protein [Spiroplasma eriocheiris CCTCC M 207170]AKM54330.1 ABC transporter permease [Spiroplasma eriocheiris]
MKQIIKSYLKAYFKNWIEAIGLILFVIIIIASLAGVLSGAIQFKIKYDEITKTSKQWDYYFTTRGNYRYEFLENYYLNNYYVDENGQKITVTSDGIPMLDKNSKWWKDTLDKCGKKHDPESQKVCQLKSILSKLQVISTIRGTGKTVDGINPSTFNYLKNYNYWALNELATRFLADPVGTNRWEAAINEGLFLTTKDQIPMNYYIVPYDLINLNTNKSATINQLKLYAGRLPTNEHEIILGSVFAQKFNYHLGDTFKLSDDPQYQYQIVGFGITLDTIIRTSNGNNKTNSDSNYGQMYFSQGQIAAIADGYANNKFTNFTMNSILEYLIKMHTNALPQLFQRLQIPFLNPPDGLLAFSDSVIAQQTQAIQIQIIMYAVIGSVLLFLGFIFINYTMKKEMNKTRKQIGIFKSFGYTIHELSWVFALNFFLTMILGVSIGYLCSLSIQTYVNALYVNGLMIPFQMIYTSWPFMVILFVVIPILFALGSFLLTLLYIKKPILELTGGANSYRINYFSNFIKHLFAKTNFIFRVQLSFTLKSFGKWSAVIFIFLISSILFIIQFNVSDIFTSMITNMNINYQPGVDHRFKFPKQMIEASTVTESGGAEKLKLVNVNNTRYFPSTNVEQEPEVIKSTTEFKTMLTQLEEAKKTSPSYCAVALAQIASYHPGYKAIYVADLVQYLTLASPCLGQTIPIPDWIKNLEQLPNILDLQTTHTILAFNQVYYNPQTELPYLNLKVSSSAQENVVLNDISLVGLPSQKWNQFYRFDKVPASQVDDIFTTNLINGKIPAIISYRFAKLAHLQVNDHFNLTINNRLSKFNVPITIKGIIKNDNLKNNVFVNYDNLKNLYVDNNDRPLPVFYNSIISKEQLIDPSINIDDVIKGKTIVKFRLQNLALNFFNTDLNNSLLDILKKLVNDDDNNATLLLNPNSISTIALQQAIAKAALKLVNNSLLIMQILNGAIIFIILAVVTSSVIDEASQIILTMRALGYRPGQVNFIVIGNYVLGIILTFIISYFLTLLIWKIALDIIFTKFMVVLNIPLNWQTPLKAGVIIGVVLVLSWMLSMYLVKKRKLNELTE